MIQVVPNTRLSRARLVAVVWARVRVRVRVRVRGRAGVGLDQRPLVI